MFDITNFADELSTNESTQPLMELIEQIMAIPEDQLNETAVKIIKGMIHSFDENIITSESIAEMIKSFELQNLNKKQLNEMITSTKQEVNEYIDSLKPSNYKKELISSIFESIYSLIDAAAERYHAYDIELPIFLENGAKIPTYAHDSDAAADISALETTVVKAHSIGNKIKTGIHLQLPENWCARLLPRSSIGAKTPLRLSNAQGLIDPAYTGDVTVLFDNISDSDYTINAGDRIAQLWIEPVYRFKSKQVDFLNETDRNDNGFGSTGK